MKKTLIALLALGSMAMGEEAPLFTIAPNTTTAATTAGGGSYTSTVLKRDDSINLDNLTTKAAAVGESTTFTASNFTNSIFSVQTNVGNGGTYTFEQDFKVEVLNGATITLTSIDVDFFAHNNGGRIQTQERKINATLTLTRGGETLIDQAEQIVTIPAIPGDQYTNSAYNDDGTPARTPGIGKFTLDNSVDLSAGNYVLTIGISINEGGGTFIGVGHVGANGSVSQVPEPATGTMSLLALAGLCARRRKK